MAELKMLTLTLACFHSNLTGMDLNYELASDVLQFLYLHWPEEATRNVLLHLVLSLLALLDSFSLQVCLQSGLDHPISGLI